MRSTSPQNRFDKHRPFSAAVTASKVVAEAARPAIWFHPNFVLRIASEPASIVDRLSTGETAAALRRCEAAKSLVSVRVGIACERLRALCRDACSDHVRRDIIQLKRDLFNMRPIPRDHAADVLREVDFEFATEVDAIIIDIEAIRADQKRLESLYQEEIRSGQSALLDRLSAGHISFAVQQANTQLFADLTSLKARESRGLSPKEIDGLHLALQNYVLRSALKTSPKSTLTLFTTGNWKDRTDEGALRFDFSTLSFQRQPRMNDRLLSEVFEALLLNRAHWADSALFRLNSTLSIAEDRIVWRKVHSDPDPSSATTGTQQLHVELLRTKPIDLLVRAAQSLGNDGFAIGDLAARLHAQTPPRFRQAMDGVLAEAVGRGLISRVSRQGAQTDRLTWAKSVLGDLTTDTASRVAPAIEAISTGLARYAAAQLADQTEALTDLQVAFDNLAMTVGADHLAGAGGPLIQEDSRLETSPVLADVRHLNVIEDDLRLLIEAAPLYSHGWGSVRYWIAEKFIARFGSSGVCNDVAEFLTPLFDEILSSVATQPVDHRNAGLPPVFNHRLAKALQERSQSFLSTLDLQRGDVTTLNIDRHWLSQQIMSLPDACRAQGRSHCINGQFIQKDPAQRFVLNAVYPGNGRMLSRFLPHDEASVGKVRRYLRNITRAGRYYAVPGVFGMNANFHPQYADDELALPPFPPDYDTSNGISLELLRLRYDQARHNIYVCDAEGTPVDCFYFGILMAYRLPKLHFLLDALSGFSEAPIPIGRVLAARRPDQDQVTFVPRLVVGALVAARATWTAPHHLLPRADASASEFFFRLLAWREGKGLPREVYFNSTQTQVKTGEDEPLMFKWRKPMFLDFESPLTVRALQRLLRMSRAAVLFTEALPARDDTIVSVGDARYVSEISFEMSFAGAGP